MSRVFPLGEFQSLVVTELIVTFNLLDLDDSINDAFLPERGPERGPEGLEQEEKYNFKTLGSPLVDM